MAVVEKGVPASAYLLRYGLARKVPVQILIAEFWMGLGLITGFWGRDRG